MRPAGRRRVTGARPAGGIVLALALVLAGAAPAWADDARASAVGLRAGSGGIGLEYAHPLGERFALRGGISVGGFTLGLEEDGIDYDATLRYGTPVGMLDFHPFGGTFRLTAGVYGRPPDIDLVADGENERIDVGAREYTASGRIDGDVDLGGVAPFLGIGWGGSPSGRGFGLSVEIGVMFADAPGVSLSARGRACESTLLSCDPDGLFGFDVSDPNDPRAATFRAELEDEARELEDSLADLRYFPVVNLGLHYRF